MIKSLRDSIEATILEAESASRKPDSNGYLPTIIDYLKTMLNTRFDGQEARARHRSSLGRIVLEDYAFANSELGTKIFDVANRFALVEGSGVVANDLK